MLAHKLGLIVMRLFVSAVVTLLTDAAVQASDDAATKLKPPFLLATFVAEVTPPVGHPLQGNVGVKPTTRIVDPLLAHGVVILGAADPIVIVSVDWCGIANDAHDLWREKLAEAAGTKFERVLVCAIHQHDAPYADLKGERLFAAQQLGKSTLDLEWHERTVNGVAEVLTGSIKEARPLTHIGTGEAVVEKVASNRRVFGDDGKVVMFRGSAMKDPRAGEAPEGLIDSKLKTLSFWNGDKALASISVYATHPMSYYGQGEVSSDFPGLARRRRQADDPGVLHFYANGCGGNLAAGKYNDGSPAMRLELAERLYRGWKTAWETTQKHPLDTLTFRSIAYRLEPRDTPGFQLADLQSLLTGEQKPISERLRAAFALSWRNRCDAGRKLDLPMLDFGAAQLLLLPGEPFVEYQLFSQQQRPDSFVVTLGYGDYGPVYIPYDKAYAEGGYEPGAWSFVGVGVEKQLKDAITAALVAAPAVTGRALKVDPVAGDDARDGISQPVRTIAQAIRLAQPGDTIHLQPRVYRDWAAFFDKSGDPGKPITLDGHGATLDGCDLLDPKGWVEVEPGLFRHDDLLPLTDAIVDRWFFVMEDKLNRMHRCSKGPSEPLKSPKELQPGEWTFVKDTERTKAARAGYIHGSFWLRLAAGQSLADAKIEVPMRTAGVLIRGTSSHIVVKNLTATRPYNDGFNLSDSRDCVFENIRAIDCGDDGMSAHGECRYRVDGFTSIGNATGICDTGDSETTYRRVLIRDCIGFDLFFLDTGTYSISDSVVISSAAKAVYLQGRDKPAEPCRLTLDNVLIRRERTENEVRISANCVLTARRVTFLNLDLQATGGELNLNRCILGGTVAAKTPRKPQLHVWKDATWRGERNLFDLDSVRVGQTTFTAATFAAFQALTASDVGSRWESLVATPADTGADEATLKELVTLLNSKSGQ